jgi:hypothetical protein
MTITIGEIYFLLDILANIYSVIEVLLENRFLVAIIISVGVAATNYLILRKMNPEAVIFFVAVGAIISFLISLGNLEILNFFWTMPNAKPLVQAQIAKALPAEYSLYWIGAWLLTVPFTWYLLLQRNKP